MFRFTIRDVLWLTVVVALGLGWANSCGNWRRRDKVLLERIFKVESEYSRLLYNHDEAHAALEAAGIKWTPPHSIYRWYHKPASPSENSN